MYFDIEANGLKPTKVHMAVCDGVDVYSGDDFKRIADSEVSLIGHNIICYDLPVVHKLWQYTPSEHHEIVDTLILSRMGRPDRPGGHSLEAWGEFFGHPKVQNEQWDVLTDVMVERCFTDVKITEKVHEKVMKELMGTPWQQAYELEAKVAPIIQRQIEHGWLLDQQKCWELIGMLQERQHQLEYEVRERFKTIPAFAGEVSPRYKQDGSLSRVGLNCLGDDWGLCAGPFSKLSWEPFNLGSRQQIAKYLQRFGWKPTLFTDNGHPIVDEKVLESVTIPEAQLICDYLTTGKRLAQIQSWLDAVGPDGRVHGYVNPIGAVTHRMTHSGPNMAQVPARKKWLGADCRSCWIVPEGYKLVGMDADGLELRMLAHYMDDHEFSESVVSGDKDNGTDVHTRNMKAAGLSDRDQAKTFIYAFLYGAGNAKIGSIVGGSKTDGKRLKAKFLKNLPALKALIDNVKGAAQRGFLKGIDGRKIWVRSEHAALNTLLQSAGAVVMKQALVVLDDYAKQWGLRYEFVGNIHDEIQAEVHEDDAEKFAMLAAASVERAGQDLGFRVPLKGSSAIGSNWSETH